MISPTDFILVPDGISPLVKIFNDVVDVIFSNIIDKNNNKLKHGKHKTSLIT